MGELHGTWNISLRVLNKKFYHCNKIIISEVYLKKKTRLSLHKPWFADPCLTIIFEFLILEHLLVTSISKSTFNLLLFLILPSCSSFICTSKQFSLKLELPIFWLGVKDQFPSSPMWLLIQSLSFSTQGYLNQSLVFPHDSLTDFLQSKQAKKKGKEDALCILWPSFWNVHYLHFILFVRSK